MSHKGQIVYPVLPLRDMVMFPNMLVPLFIGRKKSIHALEQANITNEILLITQKKSNKEVPKEEDLYNVGIVASILQVLKMQDGTVKVLVEGVKPVQVMIFKEMKGYTQAIVEDFTRSYEVIPSQKEAVEALRRSLIDHFEKYVKLTNKVPLEVINHVAKITSLEILSNLIASHIMIEVPKRQQILECKDTVESMELMLKYLDEEIEMLNMESTIRNRVRNQIDKNQREYYLNEQLKAIHKELGESDLKEELKGVADKIEHIKLSLEAKEKVTSELNKLKTMSSMSAEGYIIRNYIDWILDLPWLNNTKIRTDIQQSEKILNKHHYGLSKIKERIIEYLAVNLRTKELKSPIICFVGAPGVGKTSLAKSIAEATGRNFQKISLGGLRDEAEIKGHRRTYIGAMPGRIIQAMKKAKASNPIILLDEIDKMSADYRGDPASALLEILDPEHNSKFNDHYLEVDYDLSQVMFIATANTMNIPYPLLDRMEIINVSGYTEEDKIEIAKNYLIPKQKKAHGLKKDELKINKVAIEEIIQYYTKEAGVRSLDREIAKISRKTIKKIMINHDVHIAVDKKNIDKFLGVKKFNFTSVAKVDLVGITNGLAYTEAGGDLLLIEAVPLYGKGDVKITGKLGDTMKESVQAAFSYIKSRAPEFGINPSTLYHKDIHIHVPEGAIPKDGPSAGIAICTSIVSALTGVSVRRDVAMTGEVTLRGNVLAIGGLREKLLAAARGNVSTVLIPEENQKDLVEMPQKILKLLKIIPVATVYQVLQLALSTHPVPINWSKEDEIMMMSNKHGYCVVNKNLN